MATSEINEQSFHDNIAGIPDEAKANAMSFFDRTIARINLIRKVFPVPPGASKKKVPLTPCRIFPPSSVDSLLYREYPSSPVIVLAVNAQGYSLEHFPSTLHSEFGFSVPYGSMHHVFDNNCM
ncbi:hypothetical protein TNCV_1661311 [Trichonephila clavipes]|nr:hypothetical protein TNCV_1661311 [Trichonephila clavipes]